MYQRQRDGSTRGNPELSAAQSRTETLETEADSVINCGHLALAALGVGSMPDPKTHAALLHRAGGGRLARAGESLVQLQQRYGNRYVQRVVQAVNQNTSPQSQTGGTIENGAGLPNQLRSGLEQLSGFDLSDVRVHYNSTKPGQLNALAYTQGQDIHVGPGQERHLPHEGWHVVQQMQRQILPTMRAQGVAINNDEELEHEADVMGRKALNKSSTGIHFYSPEKFGADIRARTNHVSSSEIFQLMTEHVRRDVLPWAQQKFAQTAFSLNDFILNAMLIFGVNRNTALNYLHQLREAREVYPPLTAGPAGPRMVFSFDQTKARLPPATSASMTRRTAAGYVNPSHGDSNVRPLFHAAALSPQPPGRDEEDWLSSPNRRFATYTPTHTQPPVTVVGHQNTVMGHGPVDAVDDWNAIGHTRPRRTNLAHNRQAGIYHGLEERGRSNASGGATRSRYRSPSPSAYSDQMYWDVDHPDFDPRYPWRNRFRKKIAGKYVKVKWDNNRWVPR